MMFRDIIKRADVVCCAAVICGITMVIEANGMESSVLSTKDSEKIIFNFEPLKAALAPDREKFTPEYTIEFFREKSETEVMMENVRNLFDNGNVELYDSILFQTSVNHLAFDVDQRIFASDEDQLISLFLIKGTIVYVFEATEKNRPLSRRVVAGIKSYAHTDTGIETLSQCFSINMMELFKVVKEVEDLNPDLYEGAEEWW
jgi:hypothetical protein